MKENYKCGDVNSGISRGGKIIESKYDVIKAKKSLLK